MNSSQKFVFRWRFRQINYNNVQELLQQVLIRRRTTFHGTLAFYFYYSAVSAVVAASLASISELTTSRDEEEPLEPEIECRWNCNLRPCDFKMEKLVLSYFQTFSLVGVCTTLTSGHNMQLRSLTSLRTFTLETWSNS
ncbi:unnamed protein product [Trifolium pratense]|uniref:Uncharacterized protein n=1 Tax=Trifolium pratense TaxID=57577 RepID=A0ACB0JJG6_TRIPR|nr:unnamed protein product [Trifolium pratense]